MTDVAANESIDKCICCSSKEFKYVCRLPRFVFGVDTSVNACTVCGCGWTSPQPSLDEEYYSINETYDNVFLNNEEHYLKFAGDLLDILKLPYSTEGTKLLDIACGSGALVKVASQRGFDAVGIDTNENVVAWAQKNGSNVVLGNILEQHVYSDKYDVIVFSHILEHLEDPEDMLRHCAGLLSDRGRILISQTDYTGLLPRTMPWFWYGWQPVEHYWHFTSASIASLSERVGLEEEYSVRNSLFHELTVKGGLKNIVARTIAFFIANVGERLQKGDAFASVLKKSQNS